LNEHEFRTDGETLIRKRNDSTYHFDHCFWPNRKSKAHAYEIEFAKMRVSEINSQINLENFLQDCLQFEDNVHPSMDPCYNMQVRMVVEAARGYAFHFDFKGCVTKDTHYTYKYTLEARQVDHMLYTIKLRICALNVLVPLLPTTPTFDSGSKHLGRVENGQFSGNIKRRHLCEYVRNTVTYVTPTKHVGHFENLLGMRITGLSRTDTIATLRHLADVGFENFYFKVGLTCEVVL
jgi:hypothetical protein